MVLEFMFPLKYYKKTEKYSFEKTYLEQKVNTDSIQINSRFYQKEYLMPNGKYVAELSLGYKEGVVPASMKQLVEKYAPQNKNQVLAMWVVLSNWGLYSYGNNPWGLELNSVKSIIPSFPNTSVVLTKKYKFITTKDSSFYQKTFVKLASFSNMEESTDAFLKLYTSGIYNESKLIENFNQMESKISKMQNRKEVLDSNKIKLFKRDTITVNDSTFIVEKKDTINYDSVYIPNPLLIAFFVYIFIKLKVIKND